MTNPKIDWPNLDSPLVYHPDYVYEIGMVTIEVNSLEVMLSDLLNALLCFSDNIGHQIYFTPKAAIARLEMLTNVIEYPRFNDHRELRHAILGIVRRAKSVMGKRHDIIHAHWAISVDFQLVGRFRTPFESGEAVPEAVDLKDLRRLVGDTRALIRDAREAIDNAYFALWPEPFLEIQSELNRTAEQMRQENFRLQARLGARGLPPRSSET